MATLADCKLLTLPKEEDPRGSLTYIYENVQVPFPIRRVFYIYDVPAGKDRGAHAHRECWQFIIAASGALEVYLTDGHQERVVTLNRPYQGLLVPPGIWAHEQEFTTGALCLVLASHDYSEADYIRSFADYLDYVGLSPVAHPAPADGQPLACQPASEAQQALSNHPASTPQQPS